MDRHLQRIDTSPSTDNDIHRFVGTLRAGLVAAQERGQTWYVQPGFDEGTASKQHESSPFYRGSIALITDSYCASACLDFADQIVAIPDAVHLGLPTAADTIYNDVAFVDVGDDFKLVLPLKVYRQRTRGNNQPWIPRYRYDGDIYDTEAVQRWTLETLGRSR